MKNSFWIISALLSLTACGNVTEDLHTERGDVSKVTDIPSITSSEVDCFCYDKNEILLTRIVEESPKKCRFYCSAFIQISQSCYKNRTQETQTLECKKTRWNPIATAKIFFGESPANK